MKIKQRLGTGGLGLVLLVAGCLLLAGMPFDSDYEWADYHGWGTGGLNLFSTPDNLSNTQALDMVNLLFEGSHVRARKGVTKVNATSLGGYGINGVYLYQKSSEFKQVLAAYDGKVYYCDPDSDSFSNYMILSGFTVSVTNNDSIVKGSGTFFTLLGYSDSIEIFIDDTTHYIYRIYSDTMLALYSQWVGGTRADATLDQPFFVNADKPTQFDTWMGDVFIPGDNRVGEWDGDTLVGDLGDTTSYKVGGTGIGYGKLTLTSITPTFTSEGYGYGDLLGFYVICYNDSTNSTGAESSTQPIFNQPLKILEQGSNWLRVAADTFWYNHGHLVANTLFKIASPFSAEKLVFAGVWDSISNVDTSVADDEIWWHWLYDTSQTWTEDQLNFGCYEIRGIDPPTIAWANIFLREDANGTVYLYNYQKAPIDHGAQWVVGDSFEIYRKYSAMLQDVPQYIAHWQDRQWQAGFNDDPNLILYSEPFDPDSFPALNFIYVDRDDGDVITAFAVMPFQDYLVAFKTKNIMAITTFDADDPHGWQVNDIVQGIGTPSQASVIVYGRNVYFYDYNGWYVLNGIEPVKISWAIEDIVADSVNRDYAHLIVGGYFDKHMWWSYPSGNSTKNNRTVLFNLETETWTKVDLSLASMYVGLNEDDENGVLLGSPDSGVVWAYGDTYFDDGTSITATYLSGWFGMDDGYESNKEFKDLQLLLDKHDSTQIYIEMFKDYSETAFTKDTIGIDDYDILKYRKRTIEDYNLGQRIQIKMTITRIDDSFQLPFFKIKWKPTDEVLYDVD